MFTKATQTAKSVNVSTQREPRRDQLIGAHFVSPDRIFLHFADDFSGHIKVTDLGINHRLLKLPSAVASSWGSALEITDRKGHVVHIDSAVLRADLDPHFAEELEREIAEFGC